VFDVIGKRRWFFLFSGLLTIPGLIFILLTPLSNGSIPSRGDPFPWKPGGWWIKKRHSAPSQSCTI